MWKVAICDDNASVANEIGSIISKLDIKELGHIDVYTNGKNLLEDCCERKLEPDILFLDVQLEDCSGIDVAKRILEVQPLAKIIFTSGFDEYFEDVYDVDHVYFVRKPIQQEKIKKALDRAIVYLKRDKDDFLCVNNKGGRYVIMLSDIYTLEKDRRKILVKGYENELCNFYGKFEDMHEIQTKGIIRCHHSFLVNLAKVTKMEANYFFLNNGRRIPISRTYAAAAKKEFVEYLAFHQQEKL